MFGEHRERITQIILTAAVENVCLLPFFPSPFLSERYMKTSLSEIGLSIVKKH